MTEENNEKEENNGFFKAKNISLLGKIAGAVIIITGNVLMWLGKLPNATASDINICGFSVMGIFGTIDANIMIDKFTGLKK